MKYALRRIHQHTALLCLLALAALLAGCGGAEPTPSPLLTATPEATATPDAQALANAYLNKYNAWNENYTSGLRDLLRVVQAGRADGTSVGAVGTDAWKSQVRDALQIFRVTAADIKSYGSPPPGFEEIHKDMLTFAVELQGLVDEADSPAGLSNPGYLLDTVLAHTRKADASLNAEGKLDLAKAKSNLSK